MLKLEKLILAMLCLIFFQHFLLAEENEKLFQVSTLNALTKGVYDGSYSLKELKKHGTLGLGTFNNLDGEMIYLDGVFYQVKTNGVAYEMKESVITPYALVTKFSPDKILEINDEMDYERLKKYIDSIIPSENIFYAFKIQGKFKYMKTRSVPGQIKPFPPLTEVVKHQAIFEFNNVDGTIVGFKEPAYTKGINVGGYHFHFLTKDKKSGGHILDLLTNQINLMIDELTIFMLVLPDNKSFYTSKIDAIKEEMIDSVER